MSAAPRPLPLDGVTVIAVEQYGAGPFGTMFLADLGAEVIKVENPAEGGDVGRHVGPYAFGPGDSHFFQSFNRNKRSITLNLKAPEGTRLLHALARHADAVLNNLRGDLPEGLGLTYAALGAVNPAIVCAHLSAYGREGPRRSWPGYDYLMQAEAGYLSLTGEPDGPPARFGLSVVDLMTGLTCALGLVSGVLGARRTGRGMDVDVSLFDTALQNLGYLATWYLNAGHMQGREPRSAHPSLTPSQLYRTGDGWIFLMCNKEKFWPILAERIGRPEWATDPRFARFQDRLANREALTAELDAVLGRRSTAEWLEVLGGAVPAAPVYDVGQALSSRFVRETGRVARYARAENDMRYVRADNDTRRARAEDDARHAGGGGDACSAHAESGAPVTMLAGAMRIDGQPTPCRAAPALGADTAEILGRVGIDSEALASLRTRGVV